MFPPVAVLIPYFLIMQKLHLLDNLLAIIIIHVTLVAVYVLSFIFSWNEFLFTITFGYQNAMTLPAMISGALTVVGIYFYRIAALSILAIIPPVILALVLSSYLVRGLTMGAIKE